MNSRVAEVNEILWMRADRYHTTPSSAIRIPQNSREFCMIMESSVIDLAMYMATAPVMTRASVIQVYTLRKSTD